MRTVKEMVRTAGVLWQHHDEFVPFVKWMQEVRIQSILEIGTGYGGSAAVFAEATGARIVSVDFQQRHNRKIPNFTQIIGDSRTDEVERQASQQAPYDLVFFDTEHLYEECQEHFRRYGYMSDHFIAQHDINADEMLWPDMGIPRFWREIRGEHYSEFINPAPDARFPRWGGIGVRSAY